jgi:glycosyltransferase involved in cell wall biosynthesis
MSISQEMSDEYKKRYNMDFVPFHNPIEVEKWFSFSRKEQSFQNTFRVLYTGRIGTANGKAIVKIAKAIRCLQKDGLDIVLEVFSPDYNTFNAKKIQFLYNTAVYPPIPYSQIPRVLPTYNLLVLPLDFDKKGIRFAKLSQPTKASEYMISGTPILVFADNQMALTKYALKEKWAYVVSKNSIESLIYGIKDLYNNIKLRDQLSKKAIKIAMNKENAEIVREQFIISLTKYFTYQ